MFLRSNHFIITPKPKPEVIKTVIIEAKPKPEIVKTVIIETEHKRKPKLWFWAILAIVTTSIIAGYFLIDLPETRTKKRDHEIEGIKNRPPKEKYNCENCCEQYALVARRNGWYPCYNCTDNQLIYLNRKEVWKYGKTCLGKEKRYTDNYLETMNLDYVIQFVGTETQCLIEEKRKIYDYPSLPECLSRNFIIIRPPGNKIDK